MKSDTPVDAILLNADDVCRRLSIGLSNFHKLRRAGKMPLTPVRLGRAVRFRASELAEWVAADCPTSDRWRLLQQAGAVRRTA
jgi:excisionase family DNA binding protein